MTKYPETAAACREHKDAQWKIGVALLKEVGWPPGNGVNDNSYGEFAKVVLELSEQDLEYDAKTLANYRRIAANFSEGFGEQTPEPQITKGLSYSAHAEAGDPVTLKRVVAKLRKDGKGLGSNNIRAARRELEGRQPYPRAVERKEEPRDTRLKPTISHECNTLKDRVEEIEAHLEDFDQPYIDAVVEQLMDITEYCRKASVRMKRGGGSKGGHLNVVGGAA